MLMPERTIEALLAEGRRFPPPLADPAVVQTLKDRYEEEVGAW